MNGNKVDMCSLEGLTILSDTSSSMDSLTSDIAPWSWESQPGNFCLSAEAANTFSLASFDKVVGEGSNTSRAADGSILAGNQLARMFENGLAF
jgi:hypothetical protein